MNNFSPVSAAVGGALIGLSAVLLMLFTGRIAGISGIFDDLINPQTSDRTWRMAFISGLIAAPVAAVLVGYPVPMPQMPGSYVTIVVGGLLVGLGTRLGSGYLGSRHMWHRPVVVTFDNSHWRVYGGGNRRGRIDASRLRRLSMPVFASLICGFVFGCGLTVSGMVQPAKVLGFLDVFGIPSGTWDPSLAVVMAAALMVASIGYAVVGRRQPLFEKESRWPTKTNIDRSLLSGALLFGIGWGLVGLCPGPAIVNLGTLSVPVVVFVIAMGIGMLVHDLWPARAAVPTSVRTCRHDRRRWLAFLRN